MFVFIMISRNYGRALDIPVPVKADSKRFIDQYRLWLRLNGYSYRTETTYVHWVLSFIRFHEKRHPKDMGESEISAFLSSQTLRYHWSPSTQKTALNALVNLYRKFLKRELAPLKFGYSKVNPRLPVILAHEEAIQVIQQMKGDQQLIAKIMYGTGLRISEALRLRVKDIDFALKNIVVRSGKGDKDRITLLPISLVNELKNRIERTHKSHEVDLLAGLGSVYLPHALARKYPAAEFEFIWQFVFPSPVVSTDPRSGIERRHHIHPTQIARAIKKACAAAKINKRITSHCFRHSFATKLAMDGVHLSQIQKLLGHSNLETTEIYLHLAEQMGLQVKSPVDAIDVSLESF
jgi:integron integrase